MNHPDVKAVSSMIARKNLRVVAVIFGSLLAGAFYAWLAGEDVNWDWLNYHEYGAFALLNGRFEIDVAPGGLQTFLNPLVYVPAYLLRHGIGAPFWGILLGAIHGLNLALIWWVSRLLLGASASAWAVLASVVIAAFGPMTLSEVGTSFSDILTALPVIAGLGLSLYAGERYTVRLFVSGLLVGAAVGLKLTNATFLIGAGVSLLLADRPLSKMGLFGAGGVAGMLATGGAWSWMLWSQFGNPVFPYFNTIFRSPEAAIASTMDTRFMPHGLLDAMAYPFYWLIGDHPSSEGPFRDPRFAVLFVLFAVAVGTALIRKVEIFRQRDKQFLLFFIVAYGLWMDMFSIHRYAIVLELLTAPFIVLLLSRLFEAWSGADTFRRPFISDAAIVILALAIVVWTQPADWSRRPWSDPYRPQLSGALSIPATYLMLQKPMGYVVPLLPPASRAYQLSDIVTPIVPGGMLDRRIRWGLDHPLAGGVWALYLQGSVPRTDLLVAYDLALDGSRACERIPGADQDIAVCPLVRKSQVPLAKPS
ncbi:MAG TPA: glycosyltransferase family 87 protein [Bradyrhizobium sp.]|nr:glycosyltransferase family 87 protein [Bradyrhizobium sp.]